MKSRSGNKKGKSRELFCPECNNPLAEPLRNGWYVSLLFGGKKTQRYQCGGCGKKFYIVGERF